MLRLEEANNFKTSKHQNIKTFQMVGPSLNSPKPPTNTTIKLLCSYGGRILPRYPDGKLRYHGGQTRVLAVPRSISFSELMAKLGELCGKTASLRCQLPTEDLDALVTITCDDDLTNLIEEYDRTASLQSIKIRAFLSNPKKCSPAHSTASGSGTCGSSSSTGTTPEASPESPPLSVSNRCVYTSSKPPLNLQSAGKVPCYAYRNSNRFCLVPNGSNWH
ncbi:putative PB1 domain-containing protein [Helianthus debilis subsp. tardiflorus]